MDYLIACYGLKGDLSPVMLKKIFHDSFENLEITRICMGKQCNRFFRNIRQKVFGLYALSAYLNLTKLNCFRVYRKLSTWSSHAETLTYWSTKIFGCRIKYGHYIINISSDLIFSPEKSTLKLFLKLTQSQFWHLPALRSRFKRLQKLRSMDHALISN